MKKILLLILVLGASLTIYFANENGWFSGKHNERRDFAITDSAGLDKIFMANKHGKKIQLEKVDGIWMVNGKYEVNDGWFKQLFETIRKVRVKSPIPKKALNGVIKNLSNDHIKVELYIKGELSKTYFVGGSTQDMLGTYMWIENSGVPFICEIPGFEGFLQPRFNLDEMTWRSRKVFGMNPDQIQSIKVLYHDATKQGYIIEQNEERISIKNLAGQVQLNTDSLMMKYYIALFKEAHAEAFGMVFKDENSDSIRNSPYWCRIEVKDKKGVQTLNIHERKINERTKQQFNMQGEGMDKDTERFYAYKNDSKDAMLIQEYVFGNFFRSIDDFKKK